jgi:hypothetical protein
METFLIIFLVVVIIILEIKSCKAVYKISYYETKLELMGEDISHVKNMSLYKMMTD